MAEATEMPFGMWTQVGPRNHVEKSSPNGMGQFFWGGISGVTKVIGYVAAVMHKFAAEIVVHLFATYSSICSTRNAYTAYTGR